jgi:signal transduction histidine kinase
VEDNGRGFSPALQSPEGVLAGRLGLVSMRERIELVGGTLEIETEEGQGTTLFVRIPLPPNPPRDVV